MRKVFKFLEEPPDGLQVIAPTTFELPEEASVYAPFGPERIEALNKLSRAILTTPSLRGDDASTAFAFWLRPGYVGEVHRHYDAMCERYPDAVVQPAGLVFHIAPGNVDTMFLYSWALSFLCGNQNAIRISRRSGGLLADLLGCMNTLMEQHPWIAAENIFCQYPREAADITQFFSEQCDLRVVWGGNETIRRIRNISLNPHASERCFSSKYSLAILKVEAFLAADAGERQQVFEKLYNDIYPFDQMACSSPHAICWVGNEAERTKAIPLFQDGFRTVLEAKGHQDSAGAAVKRYSHAFEMAAENRGRVALENAGCLHVDCTRNELVRDLCGGGFLSHYAMGDLTELAGQLSPRDQTIVHYGFKPAELKAFAQSELHRGIDRMVPLGASLNFHHIWDGFDLLRDFSRLLHLSS